MANVDVADFSPLLLKDEVTVPEVLAARRMAYASGHARSAFKEFMAGLESKASDSKEKVAVAVGNWIEGRFQKAVDAGRPLKSSDAAQYVAARSLLALGKASEARDVLKPLAAKFKCCEIVAAYAEALRKTGDTAGARHIVREALEKAGHHAGLLAQAGILADTAGESEAAVELYRKAIEIDAECVEALFRLAYAADLRGDNDAALEMYRKCAAVKPVRSRVLINLGLLYEEIGLEEEAARCFEVVAGRFPTNVRARLYLKDALAGENMFFDEEQHKRRERRNKILETPISDFELSVRSRNCLEKMNVTTIGDLTRITEMELLAFKNFGETSLNEIKQMMTSKGLRLGQALEADEMKGAAKPKGGRRKTIDKAKVLVRSVDDLGLSVRSQHCMQMLGVKTIADLAAKTERELMQARNFGATSLAEVKKKLAVYGLSLAE